MLHSEVPENIMSGETSDISQYCELEWYEWVKSRDTSMQFPEDKLVLGRYLGPSIDAGPALTAKILKENGKVVHRSAYRGLTPENIVSPIEQVSRKRLDEGPKHQSNILKSLVLKILLPLIYMMMMMKLGVCQILQLKI